MTDDVLVFEDPHGLRDQIPAAAEQHRQTGHEIFALEFPYDSGGIAQLDRAIDEHFDPRCEPLPTTVFLMGSYAGETLRRLAGGSWHINQGRLYLDVGDTGWRTYPFERVARRFADRSQAQLADWLANQLAYTQSGLNLRTLPLLEFAALDDHLIQTAVATAVAISKDCAQKNGGTLESGIAYVAEGTVAFLAPLALLTPALETSEMEFLYACRSFADGHVAPTWSAFAFPFVHDNTINVALVSSNAAPARIVFDAL